MTATTRFDIASNTKMYAVNLALQMLVGQGRIDLSRQVCTFPGWEAFRDESTVYTGSWTVGAPAVSKAHSLARRPSDWSTSCIIEVGSFRIRNIPTRQWQASYTCRTSTTSRTVLT